MAVSQPVHFDVRSTPRSFLHKGRGSTVVKVGGSNGSTYWMFAWGCTVFVMLSEFDAAPPVVLRYDLKSSASIIPYITGAAKKMSKGSNGGVWHAHLVPGGPGSQMFIHDGSEGFPGVSWAAGFPESFCTDLLSPFPAPTDGSPAKWEKATNVGDGTSLQDALTGNLPAADRSHPPKDSRAAEAPHNSPVLRNLRTPEQYVANLIQGLGK